MRRTGIPPQKRSQNLRALLKQFLLADIYLVHGTSNTMSSLGRAGKSVLPPEDIQPQHAAKDNMFEVPYLSPFQNVDLLKQRP